jgi:glutathione S-transferase
MTVHQLIGAEVSLYTGKVRAYLRYKDIPFREVLATREVYQSLIVPRTGVRFIPVLISDRDVAIQDSTAIIDHLEQRYPEASVYPDGPLQRLVALLLEVYADEWLVIPAMHYRWNIPENRAFAIEEFGRLSAPDAEPSLQREIGEKLAGPFAGALPALGVSPETRDAVEASYLALLAELGAHFSDQPFLLGTRPSIADFALYGPLYAHLYRDPASGRLMRERAPEVAGWVERMTSPRAVSGAFLADDAVPKTLEPLLRRMFAEQGPVLASTLEHLAAYARERRELQGPLPRALGKHGFMLAGARGERAIYPFNIWRWQRAYAQYRALPPAARERADALLDATGGRSLLQIEPTPVRRENNRLMLA